jgi:hypothetical protein
MEWVGHVARILAMKGAYKILVEKRKERVHLRTLGLNGKIILDWILKMKSVALSDLVVIVLAIGPTARGFKPGRGRWVLRVIRIRSTTFFRY